MKDSIFKRGLLFSLVLFCLVESSAKIKSGSSELNAEIEKGMVSLYNYRLIIADNISADLVKKYPNFASVRLLRAYYYWTLCVGGLYSEKNRNLLLKELTIAEKSIRTKVNVQDLESTFCLISIFAMKSRIYSLEGNMLKSIYELIGALRKLKDTIGREDEFPKLYLTSGLFYYYRSYAANRYPFSFPYLILLPEGNKEKGLKFLYEGFRSADPYLSCESGYFLSKILINNRDYTSALPILIELNHRYPNNLLISYMVIDLAQKTDKYELARNVYKKIILLSPTEVGFQNEQKEYFLLKMKEVIGRIPKRH